MRKKIRIFPYYKGATENKLNSFLEELARNGISPDRIRIHATESYLLVEWAEWGNEEPIKIAVAEKVEER